MSKKSVEGFKLKEKPDIVGQRIEQLHLLQTINNAINTGATIDEILKLTTEGVKEIFNYSACDAFLLDREKNCLILKSVSADSKIIEKIEKLTGLEVDGYEVPLFEGSHFNDIISRKNTMIFKDPAEFFKDYTDNKHLKNLAGKVAKAAGFEFGVGIPMLAGDDVLGVLGVAGRGNPRKQDIKELDKFVTQLALAIKKKQTEETLREREERYRSLVENAKDVIFTLSPHGTIESLNPAFEDITGWPCAEWEGKHFSHIISPQDLTSAEEIFEQALRGEFPPTYELRVLSSSGEVVTGEFKIAPQFVNGLVVGVLGIARDITKRKRKEKETSKNNKQLILTQTINNKINSGEPLESVFETVTKGINYVFGYDACDIFLFKGDERDALYHVAMAYDSKIMEEIEKLTGLKAHGLRVPLFEGSGLKEMVDKREPVITKDIKAVFRDFSDKKELQALAGQAAKISKIKQVVQVPLIAEDTVLGVLGVATRKKEITNVDYLDLDRFASQLALIIKGVQAREELRDSEEKYRELFQSANDAIYLWDLDDNGMPLKCLEVNDVACEMLGYSRDEFFEMTPERLIAEEQRPGMTRIVKELLARGRYTFEITHVSKGGRRIPVEVSSCTFKLNEKKATLSTVRDITKRKAAEEEMKRRLMKFDLNEGIQYLVKEPTPLLSLEAFNDLLNVGYRGLLISRMHEEEAIKAIGSDFEFSWLCESAAEKAQSPDLTEIEAVINATPRKHVVLLDRLDYLISKNGFTKTLHFIQHLREIAYLSRLIIILSIDPCTLGNRELRLLEKETSEVKPRYDANLPHDLLEILRFVYEQNTRGIKPSYTDIRKKQGMSKPTVGKKVKLLTSGGYVHEDKRGMYKVVTLSEKGKTVFLSP